MSWRALQDWYFRLLIRWYERKTARLEKELAELEAAAGYPADLVRPEWLDEYLDAMNKGRES